VGATGALATGGLTAVTTRTGAGAGVGTVVFLALDLGVFILLSFVILFGWLCAGAAKWLYAAKFGGVSSLMVKDATLTILSCQDLI
jgi:hypothetical protein